MKKISKINQLILRGLLAENEQLFVNRLSLILDFKGMDIVELLAEGVIIDVHIIDMDAAIAALMKRNSNRNWSFSDLTAEPCEGSRIKVKYTYHATKYFSTQTAAERYTQGYSESGVSQKDDEHLFEGVYTSTSSDNFEADVDWAEVEIL